MFDKRQSYLNERIYKKHEGGVRTPELWKELFGDASCQMIENRYPQVRAYFAQEPYTVEEGWPDACDGKIFTYEIRSALKIRTGETGYDAIQESE